MRKLRMTIPALLAAGALTATASPASAQPADITVPLGGTCVINVTQVRVDGDCTAQAVIAAGVAVLGVGSLAAGSLGSSDGNPPVDPNPGTGPLDAASYRFEASSVAIGGIRTVGVYYVGVVPQENAGTYELRQEGSDGETIMVYNPDTPVGDGMGGGWVENESGRFVVVYTPAGGEPVEVAYYYYGQAPE